MKKITKNTTLAELLNDKKSKKYIEILNEFKLPCLHCPFAIFEIYNLTLEDVCKNYQIDLKDLLKKLNKIK